MNVLALLANIAGASNEIFKLVGSPMQADAATARTAVSELIKAANHASATLRAKGGPTAAERDEAVARLSAAVARVRGT